MKHDVVSPRRGVERDRAPAAAVEVGARGERVERDVARQRGERGGRRIRVGLARDRVELEHFAPDVLDGDVLERRPAVER